MSTTEDLPATPTVVEAGVTTLPIAVTGAVDVPAERVLELVCDFGARRGEVFSAVSAKHLTVHSQAATTADVTEGTPVGPFVMWERCTYDWSRPGVVTATVTDSNVYAFPASLWEIGATPTALGWEVVMTWRRGFLRTPRGRFMGFVYRHQGKRAFTKYAAEILRNLEARGDASRGG